MSIEFAVLALMAAFLQSGWNALVKAASDKLLVLSSVALAAFVTGFRLIDLGI